VRVFLELVPWGGPDLLYTVLARDRPAVLTLAAAALGVRRPAGLRARALLLAGTNAWDAEQNHTATPHVAMSHRSRRLLHLELLDAGGPPQPRLVTCGGRPTAVDLIPAGPHEKHVRYQCMRDGRACEARCQNFV
jgi:hypothetical protein